MSQQPNFRRGAQAAKEAAAQKNRHFDRIDYFKLEDGDSAIIRFLTDANPHWVNTQTGEIDMNWRQGIAPDGLVESPVWIPVGGWITCDQHSMVPTKGAPADYKGTSWPTRMGANCRKDPAFAGMFPDCFICDHMKKQDGKSYFPQPRVNAYAFLREENYVDGVLRGYKTKTVEVEVTDKDGKATGEKKIEPVIVHVQMADKNFFSGLRGYADHFGTLLDQDIKVTRSGAGMNDTTYTFIPLGQTPNPDPETSGLFPAFDLRNPKVAAKFGVGDYCPEEAETHTPLWKIVLDKASDDFYGRFFDTRVTATSASSSSNGGGAPEAQQAKPATDVADPARMGELVSRLKGMPEAPEGAAPAAAPAAEPVPAAAPSGASDFDS